MYEMDAARTEDGGRGMEDDDEDGVRTETGSRGEGGGLHLCLKSYPAEDGDPRRASVGEFANSG